MRILEHVTEQEFLEGNNGNKIGQPVTADYGYFWSAKDYPRINFRVSWDKWAQTIYAVPLKMNAGFVIELKTHTNREDAEAIMSGWAESNSPVFHDLDALDERCKGYHR